MRISYPTQFAKMPRWIATGVGLSGISMLLGCGSDTTGPAPTSLDKAYWKLELNHRAVTLALTPPYDTITLRATPKTADGAVVTDTGTTTYRLDDSNVFDGNGSSVTVSPTGLVHAVAPVTNLTLIVRHTIGNRTEEDRATINVNAVTPVPRVKTLHLLPGPTASTHIPYSWNGLKWFTTELVDVDNAPIATDNVNMEFYSGDSTTLSGIIPGFFGGPNYIYPNHAGPATVYGRAMVYGVEVLDSLTYTFTELPFGLIAVVPRTVAGSTTNIGAFTPGNVKIAAGGTVVWANTLSGQSVDVVFDNPSAAESPDSVLWANRCRSITSFVNITFAGSSPGCVLFSTQSGGNIPAFAPVDTFYGTNGIGIRARRFPSPGVYPYHSTLYGTSGVITVE